MLPKPTTRLALVFAALLLASACANEVTTTAAGGATATSTTSTSGAGGAGQGGESQGGTAGTGGYVECDPGEVFCNSPTPECPLGEVASVHNNCWGPCVPVLSCEPVPSCEECGGFCAAYQGWTTEYRCVMPSVYCAAIACVCLAQYLCAEPYDLCVDVGPIEPGSPMVSCECPDC